MAKRRSARTIIDQTLELARQFYAIEGYTVRKGHRFDRSTHPQECRVWRLACVAQEFLTDTDVHEAFLEIDENEEETAEPT